MSKKTQIIFGIVSLMILITILPAIAFGQENQQSYESSEMDLPASVQVLGSIIFIYPLDMQCDITSFEEIIRISDDESAEVSLTARLSTPSVNEIDTITVYAPDKNCRIVESENQVLTFKTQYPMPYEIPGRVIENYCFIFENIKGCLGPHELGGWARIDLDYQIEGFVRKGDYLECYIQNCLSGDFNDGSSKVRITFPNDFRLNNEPLYLTERGSNHIVLQVIPSTTEPTFVEFYVAPILPKPGLLKPEIIGVVIGVISILVTIVGIIIVKRK